MTIKQIDDIIKDADGLKSLTQVLTEVSALRLKRIRKQVEGARTFFTEISSLYGLIKSMPTTYLPNKQGTVSILLTSNFRFNGHLNNEIISFFVAQTNKLKTDCIVIGSLAKQIFKGSSPALSATYFSFQKDIPSGQELINLVEKIKGYDQILVFYSEFKTVLLQLPTIKDITQTQKKALQNLSKTKLVLPVGRQDFILEPELTKILQFFDTHVKIVLLRQAFLEAELSRVATRLITMDQAQSNAQEFLYKQQILASLAKRNYENKEILEAWTAGHFRI